MSQTTNSLKERIGNIIFNTDTPMAKTFDLILIWAIIISVTIIMLDSVDSISDQYGYLFDYSELFFTVLFTSEYILRVYSSRNRLKYMFSFYGLIDFFSILPTYLSYLIPGTQYLLVIRILRVLRIFRILKLAKYLSESHVIYESLIASRRKIAVFMIGVVAIAVIVGCVMYLVEGSENGFDSIPKSIYWTIVTLTTVGYGDLVPQTSLGKFFAATLMIMGYGIIAVPTGIITAGIVQQSNKNNNEKNNITCSNCGSQNHSDHAKFCNNCGEQLFYDI